jgi:hypothetical protein
MKSIMTPVTLGPFDFRRIVTAAQKVEERLLRATAALDAAGLPYAVIGGNAVANWITRVDESLVRFTRDVDLLLRREDLPAAAQALVTSGFVQRHVAGIETFLDGPDSKAGDAVHILFANERVRASDPLPAPSVDEFERARDYRVLNLPALVRMKLNAFRDKDRTHLRDLIGAGLVDLTWLNSFPPVLRERLELLFNTPEG